MEPICFTWNLGIFRNLYLEPLLGTSEPSGTLYDWNPYLEPRNLPEPLLGTLILGTSEPSEPYLEPLLGTSEPAGTFTWNPDTWNLGTFGTLLGTLTWNLGTCRNLYLEPLLRNLYLEPLLGTWEPLLGTLTWNLGTCRNLYLEPLLGTSEPARTWRDDCPRVPQGLVWLGPQSFQLLGNKIKQNKTRQDKASQRTNQPTKQPNNQKTKQPNIQPSNQPTKQKQTSTPNQTKPNHTKTKQERNKTNKATNQQTNQHTQTLTFTSFCTTKKRVGGDLVCLQRRRVEKMDPRQPHLNLVPFLVSFSIAES